MPCLYIMINDRAGIHNPGGNCWASLADAFIQKRAAAEFPSLVQAAVVNFYFGLFQKSQKEDQDTNLC